MFKSVVGIRIGVVMLIALLPMIAFAQSDTVPNRGSIAGEVVDSATGQPVASAQVSLRGTRYRTMTAFTGRFTLRGVPAGEYTLDVRRIGYQPLTHSRLVIAATANVTLRFRLISVPFQLAQGTVSPGSFSFSDGTAAVRQSLTRTDIESAPFGEDLFRGLNRIPGLTSGDYGAQFSIRGGRADETLVLFDGLEIFEPFHLKDFSDGALSIFDVEAIDGVDVLTGGFSAHYGDRRSGVVNITSRTAKRDRPSLTVGASLANVHALGEGRFANQRGSWLVSGRSGFAGVLLNLINQSETRAPTYQDMMGTLRFAVAPNHTLSLNLLYAKDAYRFNISGTTGFMDSIRTREKADNRYGNSYAWLTLRSQLGPAVSVRTLFSAGSVTATRSGDEERLAPAVSLYSVAGRRNFSVYSVKQDYSFQPNDRMLFDWGFDLRSLRAQFDWLNRVTQNPDNPTPDTTGYYPRETRRAKRSSGTTTGAYVSNRIRVFNPLTLEVGVRYDAATYSRDSDLSPRLHALFRLSANNSVRAGWGQYRQRQGIADENAFTAQNRYFPSELSRQWSASFEHLSPNFGTFRVEAYHKTGSSLRPILRNWKSGLNVFPESAEDRILVYPISTMSKGVEMYIDRRFGTRAKLRAAYSLAVGRERVTRIDHINDPLKPPFAVLHPIPQDQRHGLNLDLSYQLFSKWTLHSALTVHSGWPYTSESGVPVRRRNGTLDLAVRPDSLYGARLPMYQRLDLRLTRRRRTANGEWRCFVEVINATNHENVLGYDVFRVRNSTGAFQLERVTETWFSILPSLGINWTRRF